MLQLVYTSIHAWICLFEVAVKLRSAFLLQIPFNKDNTGKLAYDRPLYARLLAMTDDMLGPSPMHIKYVLYVYNRLCI